MASPRTQAAAILSDLGIQAPADLTLLEDIAWQRGALVRDMPIEGAEARLAVHGRRAIITVSSKIESPQRRRFGIAHELGHFEMHRTASGLTVCVAADLDKPPLGRERDEAAKREADASAFASHLLIPDHLAKPLVVRERPTLDLVRHLADTFDVSLMAAAIAFMRICTEACAVAYSQANRIKWFIRSKDMEEDGLFIAMGPLDRYTIAAEFFRGRPLQPMPGRVDAASWFAPGRFRSDAMIKEHSVAMPRYNGVLSLLWVEDDIFG